MARNGPLHKHEKGNMAEGGRGRDGKEESYVSILMRCEQQGEENPVGIIDINRNRGERTRKILMTPS